MKNFLFSIFLFLFMNISCNNSHIKNITASSSYQLIKNWPQLPDNFKIGNPTGIGIDTNQNIFIFHRAKRTWPLSDIMPSSFIADKTILILDKETGKILNS